ncbi:hypothetical protein TrRE_jg2042, partial [Triparma retinervis]
DRVYRLRRYVDDDIWITEDEGYTSEDQRQYYTSQYKALSSQPKPSIVASSPTSSVAPPKTLYSRTFVNTLEGLMDKYSRAVSRFSGDCCDVGGASRLVREGELAWRKYLKGPWSVCIGVSSSPHPPPTCSPTESKARWNEHWVRLIEGLRGSEEAGDTTKGRGEGGKIVETEDDDDYDDDGYYEESIRSNDDIKNGMESLIRNLTLSYLRSAQTSPLSTTISPPCATSGEFFISRVSPGSVPYPSASPSSPSEEARATVKPDLTSDPGRLA